MPIVLVFASTICANGHEVGVTHASVKRPANCPVADCNEPLTWKGTRK